MDPTFMCVNNIDKKEMEVYVESIHVSTIPFEFTGNYRHTNRGTWHEITYTYIDKTYIDEVRDFIHKVGPNRDWK
jgi:hypothetical protein